MSTGTSEAPLRVAIVGSGPSGFYAAEYIQKQAGLHAEIDMFERLPTPYGLVRGGVAPDHQKIKSVTKVYDKIAADPRFRFYGNVTIGQDLTHADLVRHYHAIIYAVGAQTDKRLDIPGEDLIGSYPATEFVAWYNGHPDYRNYEFDLSAETAVVVGIGNVAMDVARILARSHNELCQTDVADYALAALAESRIRRIIVMGRRGPVQAAFTNPEIKELGEMEQATVKVWPEDLQLDPISQAVLDSGSDKVAARNVEILRQYALYPVRPKEKVIEFRFLVSPVEIIGTDKVEAVRIVRNKLVDNGRGGASARATGEAEQIQAGLVFRSVGYRGVPLPDVPFHEDWGTIPNDKGRILTRPSDGERVTGAYVVGWIKRGPNGIIGTNKPDSAETVDSLLEDLMNGAVQNPDSPMRASLERLLADRRIRFVTFEDWQRLDALEQARGEAVGRPRIKLTSVDEMLAALDGKG